MGSVGRTSRPHACTDCIVSQPEAERVLTLQCILQLLTCGDTRMEAALAHFLCKERCETEEAMPCLAIAVNIPLLVSP